MLVKQHAMELARHGITVNGVAPTVVRTAMANHWLDNPVTRTQILDRIPLGRVGEPDDVVGPGALVLRARRRLRHRPDSLRRRRRHGEPVADAFESRLAAPAARRGLAAIEHPPHPRQQQIGREPRGRT